MKYTIAILATIFSLFAVSAIADMNPLSSHESANATRACTPIGNPIVLTTTTSSAVSSVALERNVVYWVYPTTATYLRVGDAAVVATTASFPLPVVLFPVLTTETVRYISARAVATGGTVYLWKCE